MRERILTRLRAAALIWVVCGGLTGTAFGSSMLIPVGQAVGIRITVEGVLVAGLSPVETAAGTVCPAETAGIRPGDVITALNGQRVQGAAALTDALETMTGDRAELTVLRGGKQLQMHVDTAVQDGRQRLGLWLRDGVTGIGTVTYIDPETGAFGALGHGVNDAESGALLPAAEGSLYRAEVVDVKRGGAGTPGELTGHVSAGDEIGRVEENTGRGIFGVMERRPDELREAVPVASPGEVVPGHATILTCVNGAEAREYDVEIARAGFAAGDGRDLTVHVTDPALLAATGGIVQGMSGSPILQNGRLVGAVTHVLTGDPTRGYGIYAQRMLEAVQTTMAA